MGGLTAMEVLTELLPGANLIYFGDTGHMPYGGRSSAQLHYMARRNIAFLEARGAQFILAACGTVTSVALADVARDAWSPSNPNGSYPRMTRTDSGSNMRVSDFYVEKADYLKISNLQVGYTFNKHLLGDTFRNIRLSLSIQNLLTLSPYSKYGDPEVSAGVITTGYDSGRYPFPRTYMLGIQLGL